MTKFDPLLFIAVASKHVLDGMDMVRAVHMAAVHYDLCAKRWDDFQMEEYMRGGDKGTLANFTDMFKLMPDVEYPAMTDSMRQAVDAYAAQIDGDDRRDGTRTEIIINRRPVDEVVRSDKTKVKVTMHDCTDALMQEMKNMGLIGKPVRHTATCLGQSDGVGNHTVYRTTEGSLITVQHADKMPDPVALGQQCVIQITPATEPNDA